MNGGRLLEPEALESLPVLLGEIGADGWLLFDLEARNPLAHRLLGLEKTTRRAFALFPAAGEPRLLYHAIEASAWRGWGWARDEYGSWSELADGLRRLLSGLDVVAMEYSPQSRVPALDRVPGGVVELVRECGVRVVSSGDLVTTFHSRWSRRELELHRRAAGIVRATAMEAFRRAARRAGEGAPVLERELMAWIETSLTAAGVSEQVGSIVASGPRAADPHYSPAGNGEPLEAGALVLVDLWGGLPGGAPADQTWMGVLGHEAPARAREVWAAVRAAREAALALLRERARAGASLRGWEVDAAARALLRERGLAEWFSHRLGHSIDVDLHGSGPNLDDLEAHDDRRLLPGVGFSVEPGVYVPGEIGVRTEVNVHWGDDGPEVTTPEPQDELLLFPIG